MSAFVIFAIIVTIGYILYYAAIITMDLHATPKGDSKNVEAIDLSDMVQQAFEQELSKAEPYREEDSSVPSNDLQPISKDADIEETSHDYEDETSREYDDASDNDSQNAKPSPSIIEESEVAAADNTDAPTDQDPDENPVNEESDETSKSETQEGEDETQSDKEENDHEDDSLESHVITEYDDMDDITYEDPVEKDDTELLEQQDEGDGYEVKEIYGNGVPQPSETVVRANANQESIMAESFNAVADKEIADYVMSETDDIIVRHHIIDI